MMTTYQTQSPTIMAPENPHQKILEWYNTRHPFRIDLVGDYAGSSSFVIDGDSLLRHVFSDTRVDFCTGFQLLHAVYVAEQFLENLRRRKCVFDVVFFEEHARICTPAWNEENAWKYAFARQVLIRHLAAARREGEEFVWRFKNTSEELWRKWLARKRPLFVMLHDGEDIVAGKEIEVEEWEVKAMVYRLMHMGEGYNVALINRVEFVDSKIFTNIIERGLRAADIESGAHVISTKVLTAVVEEEGEPTPQIDVDIPDTIKSGRERLTVYTLIRLLKDEASLPENTVSQALSYLLHTAYLKNLSLEERHFRAPQETFKQIKTLTGIDNFLELFHREATMVLKSGLLELDEEHVGDLCDFVDGRLLLKLLIEDDDIPEAISQDFERLAAAVKAGVSGGIGLSNSGLARGAVAPLNTAVAEDDKTPSKHAVMLPFSNPIFDTHLQIIKLDIDTMPVNNDHDDQAYREQYHWHNPKAPLATVPAEIPKIGGYRVAKKPMLNKGRGIPVEGVIDRRAQGRLRKWEQIYFSQMQRYAASLTDSSDGSLNPKLVICDEGANKTKKVPEKSRPEKKNKPEKGKAAKGGRNAKEVEEKPGGKPGKQIKGGKKDQAGKKAPVLSKAEQLKLANSERLAAQEAKRLQTPWEALWRKELAAIKDNEYIITRLDDHLKRLERDVPKNAPETHEGRFLEIEVRLYKVYVLQKMWSALVKAGEKEKGYGLVAVLFDESRKILQRTALTSAVKTTVENVFGGLGIAVPPSKTPVEMKRIVSFQVQLKWEGKVREDTKLGMTSEEFQLLYFGPYMDRNMDSAPDDRVSFDPDAWQRQVLDEIDEDNSVFVVAPTSAGKTFISFHAMEKILKQDDNSVLVYVAPTKALVNQIAAEVISRFRKNYKHAGKTVWSIHTRDYRMNKPDECQILITVPEILAIMLLSPTNAKNWAPRVKRIIFDEVHSIGNAEDGVVWEQLLLLAPCPIIALSATVGNPDEFSEWLKATQSSLGYKLTMVLHPHRYSDLRKFIYQPPKEIPNESFNGLPRKAKFGLIDDTPYLRAIHPVSALVDASMGIPDDLALEPRDCLRLYQVMKEVASPEYPMPADLDYKKVFGTKGTVIRKADAISWEASLKSVLKKWMKNASSPFTKVVQKLRDQDRLVKQRDVEGSAGPIRVGGAQEALGADNFAEEAFTELEANSLRYLEHKTLPLLVSLHAANALPAILFSYDRSMCEFLALQLVIRLKDAETYWRETDPRWKAKLKEWEAHMERKKKSKVRTVRPGEGETRADLERDTADTESSPLDSFDPNAPSPEFSFADIKKHGKEELDQDLSSLERWGIPAALIEAFKRGVGVHHAGMNRKYRQAVETLFRKGYLRVVIATGTLALGINMPCKTVVFAGESVYLTALNYRQASGRAGRRGFDLLGNVIFHGLSLDGAHRLMSSRLPSLMGHFPISTSLVLRLFILLHNSKESAHAKMTINSLLTQPRLVIGGESFKEQVLHHLRFSIEFLRRQQLIGPTGTPFNFAGLTSHLYYTETAAFAFHTLLISGYFVDVCDNVFRANQYEKEDICLKLMLVLSNIFGRRLLPKSSRYNVLPDMPEDAREILLEHNRDTLETYTTYVKTFAKQYCAGRDNTLPFSQRDCGGPGVKESNPNSNVARSSFVALSGCTDRFTSVSDLTTSVRSGIFLEGASVPYLSLDSDLRLNSYLFDFYKHGEVRRLAVENGIRSSDVWFNLKDFSLILATITAGLVCFIRDGPGKYFDAEKITIEDEDGEVIGEEIEENENEEEVIEEVVEETVSGGSDYGSEGTRVVDEEERRNEVEAKQRMKGFAKVLKGMRLLQTSFDEQFKAMWA